jgi:hypothetical protein
MVVGPRAKTSAEIGARERQSLSTEHVVEFRENDDDSGPNLKSNAAATVSAPSEGEPSSTRERRRAIAAKQSISRSLFLIFAGAFKNTTILL